MSCTGSGGRRELQITAYLDSELDLTSALELEEHLARCPDCARSLAAQRALGQAIAAADLRFRPAPEQVERLRQRLAGGKLRSAEEGSPLELGPPRAPGPRPVLGPSRAPGRRAARPRAWLRDPRLRAVAALLVVAVASWSAGRRWPARPEAAAGTPSREARPAGQVAAATAGTEDRLTEQVLAGHVRSVLAGRPEDVATSDRHTIKPWFAGRLDYSPPVVDLAARGFPLRGGRLDYVGGRPVAVLVYQAGNHLVSVYVWPAEAGSGAASGPGAPAGAPASAAPAAPAASSSRRGFNQLRWTQAGMAWWAISDVGADRLAELVRDLRAELAAAPAAGSALSPPPSPR
jgi:anti-sigma factor RsiW